MKENVVWSSEQSQAVNTGSYLFWWVVLFVGLPLYLMWKAEDGLVFDAFTISLIAGWVIFPLMSVGWRYLVTNAVVYELTEERLSVKRGVFNLVSDELELYRVRDYTLYEPLFLRIFGVSVIVLDTSDRTTPVAIIDGVKGGGELISKIRSLVEVCRKKKGVREIDVEQI
jgi:uncharacterized membrane protein YdbT with pleckstrin-like domain